jgi:hypothetical protein
MSTASYTRLAASREGKEEEEYMLPQSSGKS